MNNEIVFDSQTSTPYDDVQRTLMNDCPALVIPMINEIFHRNHRKDEKITFFNNEIFINRQNGKQIERITDSQFLISDVLYHFEVQSSVDGTILIRVFEYVSQIALKFAELKDNELHVTFPSTALLYLRHNQSTPDSMKIVIETPESECSYHVPVMKSQTYNIEEIFEKDLLFLLPFYLFIYEKNFPKYESDEESLKQLQLVYLDIANRLDECIKEGTLDEFTKLTITDMMKKVINYLAVKHEKIKKGLGDIMGGKILEHPAKTLRNEGRKQTLLTQIRVKLDKGKSIEVIADEIEESVEKVMELMKEL